MRIPSGIAYVVCVGIYATSGTTMNRNHYFFDHTTSLTMHPRGYTYSKELSLRNQPLETQC